MNSLKSLILKNLTLAQIDDGADFASVEEWLEFASDQEIQNLAEDRGLIASPSFGELCERYAAMLRRHEARLDEKDAAL